jgi:hypothetical protein
MIQKKPRHQVNEALRAPADPDRVSFNRYFRSYRILLFIQALVGDVQTTTLKDGSLT